MKLLFKRSQAQSQYGRPIFELWAKIEFEDDESLLINQYKFEGAKLIEAIQPTLMRNTVLVSLATFVACIAMFSSAGWAASFVLSLITSIGAGWFFYDRSRETIFVRDLIHGRYFECKSIIDLARKEAWLGVVTSFLRQVVESAKNWDGTETRQIEALSKEEAKYVVIRGL